MLTTYPTLPPDWKVYTQRLPVFYCQNIPEMLGKSANVQLRLETLKNRKSVPN